MKNIRVVVHKSVSMFEHEFIFTSLTWDLSQFVAILLIFFGCSHARIDLGDYTRPEVGLVL